MRRVLALCLLGLLAWLLTLVVRFPAAPVLDRVRPQLEPIVLEGVEGALIDGRVERVRSTDDLLPIELGDVRWTLAPSALPRGVGANVVFDAYGGGGEGQVVRAWNGDIVVGDLSLTADAKALEPLLPVPIAAFSGDLSGDIARLVLDGGRLLTTFEGRLGWSGALLERPLRVALGEVDIVVSKEGEDAHVATLAASGGDVAAEGTARVTLAGDYTVDLLLTPADSATPELRETLARLGRPEAGNRFRLQQSGNVNRLM